MSNQCFNNGCNRCNNVIFRRILNGSQGPVGPTGPTGLTGPTGATGATGPTGVVEALSYGSFYNTDDQVVNNASFPLTNVSQAEGVTVDTTTGIVTLTNVGVYRVDYGVLSTNAVDGDRVALNLDGTEVAGTGRGLVNDTMVSGSTIIETTGENSTLNIQVTSSGDVTFSDANGINGYLNVVQIA